MQKKNYQKMLDEILADKENYGKKLLLHSCCAPCSSYVLEYLRGFFRITVFYYNPNITEEPEYHKREPNYWGRPALASEESYQGMEPEGGCGKGSFFY